MEDHDRVVDRVPWDLEAVVVSRPNRFLLIADVIKDGGGVISNERIHVHDPGRLKEIIFPGNRIRIKSATKPGRTTAWDLVFGMVGGDWVLVNSSNHRKISESILTDPDLTPIGNISEIQPEFRIGKSRLDFRLILEDGDYCFVEVKGCTLTKNGKALFPDAPTTRGTRHLRELVSLKKNGHRSAVIFLVLGPSPQCFSPNSETDPEFTKAFDDATKAGVEIYPLRLHAEDDGIILDGLVPLCGRS